MVFLNVLTNFPKYRLNYKTNYFEIKHSYYNHGSIYLRNAVQQLNIYNGECK